jgi:hypothetical protein
VTRSHPAVAASRRQSNTPLLKVIMVELTSFSCGNRRIIAQRTRRSPG